MKFGQLINYNRKNIFIENNAENEAGRLVPLGGKLDLFLLF